MRTEMFDFIGNLDTLAAVFLGAILATLGGLAANFIEYRTERGRRERATARFFGEVLSSLDVILYGASESRKIGEPYGRITMRMLTVARREVEVYERNRERLFDISDAELRAQIHILMLRQTLSLESIIEATEEILTLDFERRVDRDSIASNDLAPERAAQIRDRVAECHQARERGFELILRLRPQTEAALTKLRPVAGATFEAFAKAAEI